MAGASHIISGMNAIVNPDNIRPGIDIKELERQMLQGGLIQQKVDPTDKFNDEMREAARALGVTFGEPPRAAAAAAAAAPVMIDESESEDEDESESDNDDDGDTITPSYSFGTSLQSKTEEQQRQRDIDRVMGKSDQSFSLEKEKREDMKCAMLAEIDSLMTGLAEDEVDLSRIQRVDKSTSYEDVESVLRILRHKQDHTRYCSFAEEFLLFGAYGLEELFDGKKQWLGYSPDLSGWHNHLNQKLRRLRCDLSTVVSTGMSDYNIGPFARILLELIPNMVLYSKMRKQQHGQPGLFSDDMMAGMNNRIRDKS